MNAFYAELDPKQICLSFEGVRRALFVGIGGGGDVVTASVLALSFERCGGEAVIASIVWERLSVDPVPGPVKLDELIGAELRDGYAIVDSDTYAIRGGKRVVPQIANVAKALERKLYALEIVGGVEGLVNGLRNLVKDLGIDLVVGIDVGGDALALGTEESLWSPLADAIGVAALAGLDRSILAIASPGADGELPKSYVLKRISGLAELGALLGGYIFSKDDCRTYEKVLSVAKSEASSIPLKACLGYVGKVEIRGGSRCVDVDAVNLAVFFLDPKIVAQHSVAKYVAGSRSIDEARKRLHEQCIATELDLEEEVYGSNFSLSLEEARSRIRERVRRICRRTLY